MNATRTLFDIGYDMLVLNDMLDKFEETSDPAILEMAGGNLAAALVTEEAAKLDGYCSLVRQLEMEEAAAAEEAERWQKRAESRRQRVRWLKDRMLAHLLVTGRDRVTTAAGRTIRVQDNGGQVPVEMEAGKIVPLEYVVVKHEPNKELIRKRLQAGEVLDFARLGERGKHLRIG